MSLGFKTTVADTELPPGWCWYGLEDVCEVLDRFREPINQKERDERCRDKTADQLFPYYGATGQAGVIDAFKLEGEAILLGEDGAPFLERSKAKAYLVSGKYWVNNHAHILRARDPRLNRFVLHQLNAIDYHSFVSGTTRLKLTRSEMGKIRLRLPATEVAIAIATQIEELFGEIEAGEQELAAAKADLARYRRAVLKAAVTGELTRDWREHNPPKETGADLLARILKERRARWEAAELTKLRAKGKAPTNDAWKARYPEPAAPNTSGLSDLPEGWTWASAATLFSWSSGDFLPNKNMVSGSIAVFGGNGITGSHTVANVQERTIIIGRVGFYCGSVHMTAGSSWVTDNAIYTKLVPDECSLGFLALALRAQDIRRRAQGGAQPFVNQTMLNDMWLAIPPSTEQVQIVSMTDELFSAADETLQNLELLRAESTHLRQSILAAAFSGKLVSDDTSLKDFRMLQQRAVS